jgi:hypothetical protein
MKWARVLARFLLGHLDHPFAHQRFTRQEEVEHGSLLLAVIVALGLPWLHGEPFQFVCDQLLARFIHAKLG